MRRASRWLTGMGAALVLLGAPAQAATGRPLTLKPTHGGALLTGTLTVSKPDELTGVWSSVGRARLLRCAPNCEVVTGVPVPGALTLNDASGYRIVLGGTFKTGQKVSLVLRYRNVQIVNLTATVTR